MRPGRAFLGRHISIDLLLDHYDNNAYHTNVGVVFNSDLLEGASGANVLVLRLDDAQTPLSMMHTAEDEISTVRPTLVTPGNCEAAVRRGQISHDKFYTNSALFGKHRQKQLQDH